MNQISIKLTETEKLADSLKKENIENKNLLTEKNLSLTTLSESIKTLNQEVDELKSNLRDAEE